MTAARRPPSSASAGPECASSRPAAIAAVAATAAAAWSWPLPLDGSGVAATVMLGRLRPGLGAQTRLEGAGLPASFAGLSAEAAFILAGLYGC